MKRDISKSKRSAMVLDSLRKSGRTKIWLAEELGITANNLYLKLNGKRRWALDDARELADLFMWSDFEIARFVAD